MSRRSDTVVGESVFIDESNGDGEMVYDSLHPLLAARRIMKPSQACGSSSKEKMFPLLRYFSLASLASVMFTIVVLGALHHNAERKQLLDIGQSNHVALTQTLANALRPQFRDLTELARTLDNEALRQHADKTALQSRVIEAMRNTQVVKLKLYDLNGRTIFSTDPSQIGKNYRDNPAFISAAKGNPMSELTHRDHFSTFDRELENLDVLSSYVALRTGQSEPIEGVVEVYSNVTGWVERTDRLANLVTFYTVSMLVLLYAALFVIVQRADRLLRIQYDELTRSGSELRIAATTFEIQQCMMVTDPQGVIVRINLAFRTCTGYSSEQAIGQSLRLIASGRHGEDFFEAMWNVARETGSWQGEIWNRRQSGEIYLDWLTICAVYGPGREITHFIATMMDITQRKKDEERVSLLAFYDPLTQLPNRRLLQDRLQHAMTTSARTQQWGAVMFIDLDHFKAVNDTLGHEIGDLMLQEVAQRLQSSLRNSDSAARLGGDEFIVMLENLDLQHDAARAQARLIGEKLLEKVNQPCTLAGHDCKIGASIGIALFGAQDRSVSEILKKADKAMYQVKAAQRNSVQIFEVDFKTGLSAPTPRSAQARLS